MSRRSAPRDLRTRETDTWTSLESSPPGQRSSRSRSVATTSFACRSRHASNARCRRPCSSTGWPCSTTSSGPRTRNSTSPPRESLSGVDRFSTAGSERAELRSSSHVGKRLQGDRKRTASRVRHLLRQADELTAGPKGEPMYSYLNALTLLADAHREDLLRAAQPRLRPVAPKRKRGGSLLLQRGGWRIAETPSALALGPRNRCRERQGLLERQTALPAKIEPTTSCIPATTSAPVRHCSPKRSSRNGVAVRERGRPVDDQLGEELAPAGPVRDAGLVAAPEDVEAFDLRHGADDPPQVGGVAGRALRNGHAPVARQDGDRRRRLEPVPLHLEHPVERQVVEAVRRRLVEERAPRGLLVARRPRADRRSPRAAR